MEFRLFGQVEVIVAGQRPDVGPPRRQAVLAALIVDAGRPVAVETLVDRVWDGTPPVEARNVLYSHLSRVRQLLRHAAAIAGEAAARVERRHSGYVLTVDPDRVDLHRFQRLIDRGRDPERSDAERADALAGALGLWRGTPLAALPGQWAAQVRSSWRQRRLDAAVRWAEIELRLSHPTAVIPVLHDLIVEHPLVEPLEGLLMRALHTAGRGAEALDRYATVRARLADELGTDPCPALQRLHHRILTDDPALADPGQTAQTQTAQTLAATAPLVAPGSVVPRQLPTSPSSFTGRADELARLDALLTADGVRHTAVVISALSGTAGIGKTALAVHWAHRVADRFPDGQLYVNLRGFDSARAVMDPAEAVRGFLDALQVDPQRIPPTPDAQAALYRSLLSGRRMLIVLDNARDSDHVRHLLPGAAGSLVVITSRNELTGLLAATGARPLTLDLLSADEARELLADRLGATRVAAEPEAVERIIAGCARLPLALTIAAARTAARPRLPLAAIAAELGTAGQRLDALDAGDPTSQVRAVFSWSYTALTAPAARLFRLLGLHPGPDVSVPAAASLTGHRAGEVARLLTELTRASLVVEHAPGRYTFHDLLRTYATDLTHTTDPDQQRRAATGRILDHYLHTAAAAAHLLGPTGNPIRPGPPLPGVTPQHLADHQQALDWFTAEHAVLLAAVEHAEATGWDAHTGQLFLTLRTFLDRRGHWRDQAAAGRAAVAATGRLADPSAQARAHLNVAHAYIQLGRLDDAAAQLRCALDLYRRAGDRQGQANTHNRLGYLWERRGRPAQALDHARQALDLHRIAGDKVGQAEALNAVGWCHALLGEHRQALASCQQALTLHQDLGNSIGEANTWDSLGYVHHTVGQHGQAIACYRRALALYRSIGARYSTATTLTRLGDSERASGDPRTAGEVYRQALTILDDLDHPDAERVRGKLDAVPVVSAPSAASA